MAYNTDKQSYSNAVMRLREINPCPPKNGKKEVAESPAAFATQGKVRCQYCKNKGWRGTSHDEKDCRAKKREQSRQQWWREQDGWEF